MQDASHDHRVYGARAHRYVRPHDEAQRISRRIGGIGEAWDAILAESAAASSKRMKRTSAVTNRPAPARALLTA